jgi:hypothetical protein
LINIGDAHGAVIRRFLTKLVTLTGPSTAFQELLSGIIMALILVYTVRFGLTEFNDKEGFAVAVIGMCVTWGIIDGILSFYSWEVDARRQTKVLRNEDNTSRESRLNEIVDSFSGTALDLLSNKCEREVCDTILDKELQSQEEFKEDEKSMKKSSLGCIFFSALGLIPVLTPLFFFDDLIEALEVSCILSAIFLFGVGFIMGPYLSVNRFILGAFLAGVSIVISVISVFTGG